MFFGSGTSFGSDYSIVVPVPQEFEYLGSVDFNPMFRILIEIRYRSYLLKKIMFSVGGGFLRGDPHGLVWGAEGGG